MFVGEFFKVNVVKIADSRPMFFVAAEMFSQRAHCGTHGGRVNKQMRFRDVLAKNFFCPFQSQIAQVKTSQSLK